MIPDTPPEPTRMTTVKSDTVKLLYLLYLASFVFGVTGIIGLILAYVFKSDSVGTWQESHYRYLIRTFWIGMLYAIISVALTLVFIGMLTGLLTVLWFIIRCAKGLKYAAKDHPMPDVTTWVW